MKKPVILIVDDEKNAREGLARALQKNYEVLLADNGQRALEMLGEKPVDVLLSDVRMPAMDGLTLLQRALARTPQPLCIMLTAYGSIELAVEAMRRGAYDFMTKPINLDRLEMVLQRALRTRDIEVENRQLHEQLDVRYGLEALIGNSPAMHEVYETVRQVAPARTTVLVEGESGTGKELVAHAIHRLSPRARGPYNPNSPISEQSQIPLQSIQNTLLYGGWSPNGPNPPNHSTDPRSLASSNTRTIGTILSEGTFGAKKKLSAQDLKQANEALDDILYYAGQMSPPLSKDDQNSLETQVTSLRKALLKYDPSNPNSSASRQSLTALTNVQNILQFGGRSPP